MTSVHQLRLEIAAQAATAAAMRQHWKASVRRSRESGAALVTSPKALAIAFGTGFVLAWLSHIQRASVSGSALRYAGSALQPMVLSSLVAWWQSRQQVDRELAQHPELQ
jgi:nitroreductase